ncbi:LOW QUALITY PROTEIN: monoacylglycerol lipase ABHD2-like [Rhynochetos jubatus]
MNMRMAVSFKVPTFIGSALNGLKTNEIYYWVEHIITSLKSNDKLASSKSIESIFKLTICSVFEQADPFPPILGPLESILPPSHQYAMYYSTSEVIIVEAALGQPVSALSYICERLCWNRAYQGIHSESSPCTEKRCSSETICASYGYQHKIVKLFSWIECENVSGIGFHIIQEVLVELAVNPVVAATGLYSQVLMQVDVAQLASFSVLVETALYRFWRFIAPLIWGKKWTYPECPSQKNGEGMITSCGLQRWSVKEQKKCSITCASEDVMMVICPGIANHSEKQYILYAKNGFRCAVLNHLRALPNTELTSPCMFTYGSIWEFGAMVNYIKKTYPQTQLVVMGFSLGRNMVCRYLGESWASHKRVLCCVSMCWGYSALRAQEITQWDQCRRFYNFLMAVNMKMIILSHRYCTLVRDNMKKLQSLSDAANKLCTATSLMQIADNINRKFGYSSLKEYEESCLHYLHRTYVPLQLVNAAADPLVHDLLSIPRAFREKRENVMHVLSLRFLFFLGGRGGGGSVLFLEPLTWMDKPVVRYANTSCQCKQSCYADTEKAVSGQE